MNYGKVIQSCLSSGNKKNKINLSGIIAELRLCVELLQWELLILSCEYFLRLISTNTVTKKQTLVREELYVSIASQWIPFCLKKRRVRIVSSAGFHADVHIQYIQREQTERRGKYHYNHSLTHKYTQTDSHTHIHEHTHIYIHRYQHLWWNGWGAGWSGAVKFTKRYLTVWSLCFTRGWRGSQKRRLWWYLEGKTIL